MKIITVVGARPQFVKAAALSRLVRERYAGRIIEHIVHTGQHYDPNMSDIFFGELDIPKPTHHLGVGSGGHGAQTGRMLEKLEEVMLAERPDLVLVYGDTNSTLAGALAASKLHIPVAHVEAGLRSFNRCMPEEQNRVLTDHLSQYLFGPTTTAIANLQAEGLHEGKQVKTPSGRPLVVRNTGDIMFDAILHAQDRAARQSQILVQLGLTPKNYVLGTIHRAENTDDPGRLRAIFAGLGRLPIVVVLALHPRTKKSLEKFGITPAPSVRIIDPVGYLDMIQLERHAQAICTDSGGVQKEAYFLRVPCLTLRDETEWVETVADGWNHLCPPEADRVVALFNEMLAADWQHKATNAFFGRGDTAQHVLETVIGALGSTPCAL